ncbi:MAG: hypothetical protein JXO51_10965 [Candidatus Aminicenantes bacterium]|nr:hypothetical protein [Candidatus Aminicenantes bacterium]
MLCGLLLTLVLPGADKKAKPRVNKAVPPPAAAAQAYLPPTITKAECPCLAGDGRKVMIGDREAHADWMVHKIRVVVPLMEPGSYALRLEKNGQLISNEVAVTIESD